MAELRKKRYPNLGTIIMIEQVLKENRDSPLKLNELKKMLPKQVMHQTLKMTLEYLFYSGKIIYGPKGVQWVYDDPEYLKRMMHDTLEI